MYTTFASFLLFLPSTPPPKKHCFSALLCLSLKRIQTLKYVPAMFSEFFSVWRKKGLLGFLYVSSWKVSDGTAVHMPQCELELGLYIVI